LLKSLVKVGVTIFEISKVMLVTLQKRSPAFIAFEYSARKTSLKARKH